jgi:hypothetical protein
VALDVLYFLTSSTWSIGFVFKYILLLSLQVLVELLVQGPSHGVPWLAGEQGLVGVSVANTYFGQ